MRKRKRNKKQISRLLLLLIVCGRLNTADAQTTYLYHHRNVSLFDGLNNDVNAKVYVSADEQYLLFKSFQGLLVFNFSDRYPLYEIKEDLDCLSIGNIKNLCVLRLAKNDREYVVVYNFEKNKIIDTLDNFAERETHRYDDHYLFDPSDENILATNKDKLKLYDLHRRIWMPLPLDPKKTAPVNFCGPGHLLFENVEMLDTNRTSSLCILNMKNYRVEKIANESKSFVLPENVSTQAGKFIFYDEDGHSNIASVIDSNGNMRVTMNRAPHSVLSINRNGNLLLYQVRSLSGKVKYLPYDCETGRTYDTLAIKVKFFPSGKFAFDPTAVHGTNGFYIIDLAHNAKDELFVPYARINKFKLVGSKIIVCGSDSTVKIMDLVSGTSVSAPLGFVANEVAVSRDKLRFTAYQSRGAMAYESDMNALWHQQINLQAVDSGGRNFQRLHKLDMLTGDRLMILLRDSIFELNPLNNRVSKASGIPSNISYGSSMVLNDSLVVLAFKSYPAFNPVRKDSTMTDAIALFDYKNQTTISLNSVFDLVQKMPSSGTLNHFIELIGLSRSCYYFEMDDSLFSLNIPDGKVTFMNVGKNLSDSLYFNVYTPQKIYNTETTFFDVDRNDIKKWQIDNTYREGFRFNEDYLYLDEQNANLNIVQLEPPYRRLALAFGYKTNQYLVKSPDLKFDGSGSIINNVYYNINDGDKFVSSEDYFVEMYEPYFLQKVLTYSPISYPEKLYRYIPTDLQNITDQRKAIIRSYNGNTVIDIKSKTLLNQILSNSTADSTYLQNHAGHFTNKIIIQDTALFHSPKMPKSTVDIYNNLKMRTEPTNPSAIIAIGVDKYPRLSGLVTLNACVSSAEKLMNYFSYRRKFDDTITLRDSKACRSDILSSIDSLSRKIGPLGTLYLYFVGHGVKSEKGAAFYFVPYDGVLKQKKITCLSSFDFANMVERTNCRHLVLIIDACYAAEIIPTLQKAAEYKSKNFDFSMLLMLATDKAVSNYQTNTTTDYYSKLTNFLNHISSGHTTAKAIQSALKSNSKNYQLFLCTWGKDFKIFDE